MVLLLCKKKVGGVIILFLCTMSDDAYIHCFVNISQKLSKLLSAHYFQTEIFKGT